MHSFDEIRDIYQRVLKREPDTNGLADYMNSPLTLLEIEAILSNCQESKERIFFDAVIDRILPAGQSHISLNLTYREHNFVFDIFNPKQDIIISAQLFKHGVWEGELSDIWYNHINPGDLVLDIGANIGWYSKLASLKGAACISIEPEPNNLSIFKRNCPDAELHEVCVGNTYDNVTMYKVDNNHGSFSVFDNIDAKTTWNFTPASATVVKQTTLDDVVGNRASLISAVKMDVEGFEEHVIQGGKNTFTNLRLGTLVIFEIYPRSIAQHNLSIKPMLEFVDSFTECYAICAASKRLIPKNEIREHLLNPKHFDWNIDIIARV